MWLKKWAEDKGLCAGRIDKTWCCFWVWQSMLSFPVDTKAFVLCILSSPFLSLFSCFIMHFYDNMWNSKYHLSFTLCHISTWFFKLLIFTISIIVLLKIRPEMMNQGRRWKGRDILSSYRNLATAFAALLAISSPSSKSSFYIHFVDENTEACRVLKHGKCHVADGFWEPQFKHMSSWCQNHQSFYCFTFLPLPVFRWRPLNAYL